MSPADDVQDADSPTATDGADPGRTLSVSILTREYPPSIYGGAGVHVAQLVPQVPPARHLGPRVPEPVEQRHHRARR